MLQVGPADEALASEFLKSSGLAGTVDATATTCGGITIVALGGSMLRRNTLEDRLAKFSARGQSEIAEVLSA